VKVIKVTKKHGTPVRYHAVYEMDQSEMDAIQNPTNEKQHSLEDVQKQLKEVEESMLIYSNPVMGTIGVDTTFPNVTYTANVTV
jgi:hypothetical protein